MRPLSKHLDDVGETYFQHFTHAIGFGFSMLAGGLACLLHALIPSLCLTTGSDCIRRLHDRMVVNRNNLTSGADLRREENAREPA